LPVDASKITSKPLPVEGMCFAAIDPREASVSIVML